MVDAGSRIAQMLSTLSPSLSKTLETAEGTYVRVNLTRYGCGKSFELLGGWVSPLTSVQQ